MAALWICFAGSILLGQIYGISVNKTYAEIKYHKATKVKRKRTVSAASGSKRGSEKAGKSSRESCCKMMMERFQEGFERGRTRSNSLRSQNNVNNSDAIAEDEEMGLLGSTDTVESVEMEMEKKDESVESEISESAHSTDQVEPQWNTEWKYDTGSKLENIKTIMGSSVLHWLLPLDWPEDELYERLQDRNHSYDLLPFERYKVMSD